MSDDDAVDAEQLRAFGAGLRRLRESRGMNRRALARSSGVHENTLASIEGGANVTVALLLRLAKGLGFSSLTPMIAEVEGASNLDANVAAEKIALTFLHEAVARLRASIGE